MSFMIDHDYHIHSYLSSCSGIPEQNAENILSYAEDNGFKEICITDHFWDDSVEGASDWYKPQNFEHIKQLLPLPQGENTAFYFGCETEMDKYNRIGISDKLLDKFDFVIIPTTHLHMGTFTIDPENYALPKRAEVYVKRLDDLLNMDLPFEKIGIAHLTCPLMAREPADAHIKLIDIIEDKTFDELFTIAAKKGVGIELNMPFGRYSEAELKRVMRPYEAAKRAGCKFYMGSDAHSPKDFVGKKKGFKAIADYLALTEDDNFRPFKKN